MDNFSTFLFKCETVVVVALTEGFVNMGRENDLTAGIVGWWNQGDGSRTVLRTGVA